jgi:hypothetical protein
VHFYVEQDVAGRKLTSLDVDACRLDHLVRWQEGQIASSMALLAELTRMPEMQLMMLTFPDADRVLAAFLEIVPTPIRDDISNGKVPLSVTRPPVNEDNDEVEEVAARARTAPSWPNAPAVNVPPVARPPAGPPGVPMPSPAEAQREALRRAEGEDEGGPGFDLGEPNV